MSAPKVGQKVKVRYTEDAAFPYTLHVVVQELCGIDRFIGRIETVFAENNGQITGGEILKIEGETREFRNVSISY